MRVLFVDDDQVVAQSVEMALRQKGHDCELAELGERAISMAQHHDYDIIVLDVGLPDVDGDQVARRMKLEGIKTPLLLQSGIDDPTLAAEARDAGAQDFLAKPFSIADLIDRMEVVLGLPRSAAAPEPKAEHSANRNEDEPETKAPRGQPAAGAVSPQGPSQDDPPQRPSAVAEARAALRAQPETPTRLQAASEVVAEGGAKALSKARAALAAQRAGRNKPSPETIAVDGPDDAAEPTAPGGVKVLGEPVARARAAFGDKPLSKATGKARAALRAKLPSHRKADDEADAEPGSDAQAGLGLRARARAALDANPLTQAVAKTRTALREKRGSRAAAALEAEPAPEAELPPQLEPEFWSEPGPANEPEPASEAERAAETELPVDREPCGPAPVEGSPIQGEIKTETQLRDAPEAGASLAFDAGTGAPTTAPAPNPELDPEPHPHSTYTAEPSAETTEHEAQAAGPEIARNVLDKPAVEPETTALTDHQPCEAAPEPGPPTELEAGTEDPIGDSAEAEGPLGSESETAAPTSTVASDPEPHPQTEALATAESRTETAEHEGREDSLEDVPSALDQSSSGPESATEAEPSADREPQPQAGPASEVGMENPLGGPTEGEESPGSETDAVALTSAGAADPEPQAQPEPASEPSPEAQERDGPAPEVEPRTQLETEGAGPIPERVEAQGSSEEPSPESMEQDWPAPEAGPGTRPDTEIESPLQERAEVAESSGPETDVGAPAGAAMLESEPRPEPAAAEDSIPETRQRDRQESSPGLVPNAPVRPTFESEAEVEGQPPVPAEAKDPAGPEPGLGSPTGFKGPDPEQQSQGEVPSTEESSPEAAKQDGQDCSPEAAPIAAGGPSESCPEAEPAPAEATSAEAAPAEETPATGEAADKSDAGHRRHDRKGIIEAAVIDDGSNQIPCVIVDLSESGARLLLLDAAQQCPWRFLLVPTDGPERHCVRRWRDGDSIGVEFEQPAADDDQEAPPETEGEESK